MDGLIAEKHIPGKGAGGVPITRTVRLYRRKGRLVCECPYACLATYERCEFADYLSCTSGTPKRVGQKVDARTERQTNE